MIPGTRGTNMGQFGPCPRAGDLGLDSAPSEPLLHPGPSMPTAFIHIPSPCSQGWRAAASLSRSGQWGPVVSVLISLLPVLASASFQLWGLEQVLYPRGLSFPIYQMDIILAPALQGG